ncbi:MAG: phosphotransacetylase [Mycoplasmataceae bacterium]|nr:phosphotransacetylase [Mycoplasmataceae bacterium]
MTFKNYIKEQIKEKGNKKKVLVIDGTDDRAVEAALAHNKDGLVEPVMLYVKKSDVPAKYTGTSIIMEEWKPREQELIDLYVKIRKGKETEEQAKKAVWIPHFFAMLMIRIGEVDGVVGGLVNPTSDILRAAFKVIGPKEGVKTISSVMIMEKEQDWFIFADISVNIMPSEDQLVDIAANASDFAKSIGFKTKVAFLSFSTSGSAVHERSTLVANATDKFNKTYKSDYPAIGEVQFDAAFDPEIRKMKYTGEAFTKVPTIFVFPSLEAGNIGYKIAQRMGGYGAIGPIITGVNKPVNDLSRGSTAEDVYNTILITAIQE